MISPPQIKYVRKTTSNNEKQPEKTTVFLDKLRFASLYGIFSVRCSSMINECSSPELGAILYIVKRILSMISIVAPILLLIMGTIHIINLVKNPDDKKRIPKIRNSAISAVVIFLVPVAVNAAMYLLDDSLILSDCWNKATKPSYDTKYMDVSDEERQKTNINNPNDYQAGEKKNNTTSGESDYTGETIDGNAQQVGDVVWDPKDVTKISNLTTAQLIAILNNEGGRSVNFIPYASSLITTEHKYSVNVFFLVGVQALESGWGTSKISKNCNNLGGVRESKEHPSNGCGRNKGGGFAYFNSVAEFNDYHGYLLHNKYLTPGGPYYRGTSPSDIVVSYCPGCTSWPGEVTSIANRLFKHVVEVI